MTFAAILAGLSIVLNVVFFVILLGLQRIHALALESWEDMYAGHVTEMGELKKRAVHLAEALDGQNKLLMAIGRGDMTEEELESILAVPGRDF